MTDKDKKKFLITQNIVVLIYKLGVDFNADDEKFSLQKLLAKTLREYDLNSLGDKTSQGMTI